MAPPLRLQRAALLTELRERAFSPESGGVRVHGPSGSGKTNLLFEHYRQLRDQPGLLVGACRFESLEEPPLFPILGAVGEAIGSWLQTVRMATESLAERLPPPLVPLARAFLRVALALGAPGGTGEAGVRWRLREVAEAHTLLEHTWLEDRGLFEETLIRLMSVTAREARARGSGRFILIFDQLERAGRRSRALVELLLGLPPSVCAAVLSVGGGLEGGASGPGVASLPALELTPLTGDELIALYRLWYGRESARFEAGMLESETEGRPLHLRYLTLAEQFAVPFDPARPCDSAPLGHMLDGLPPGARDLLGVLALLPSPLYLGRREWAELLRVDAGSLEPVIQGLIEQGVLGSFPRTLAIAHEQLRLGLLEQLPDTERAELGARIAKFLECQYGRDRERGCVLPVLGAFHVGIGLAGDLYAWLKTATELCEGWYSLGEWEQAWSYGALLREHAPLLEVQEQARLFNIIGMVAYQLERWDEAVAAFEQARSLALAEEDHRFANVIRLNLAGVLLGRGDFEGARLAYRALVEKVAEDDQAELSWQCWAQLAVLESQAGATVEALSAYLQAIKSAEVSKQTAEVTRLKQDVAEFLLAHGELEAGLVWLKQALDDLRTSRDPKAEAQLLERIATGLERLQQLPQAEGAWLEALACVQDDGHAEGHWCTIANNYGSFLHRIGRYDDAVRVLQRALEVARASGRTAHEARILNNLAMLCESLGAPQLALEHARNSLLLKQRIGDLRGVAVGRNNLGTMLFSLKQYDEAMAELQECLELWRRMDDVPGEAIALNNLAMLHERRGEFEKALRCYRSSLALKEMMQDPGGVRHTLTNMVLFLDELKRFSKAEDCMRALISLDRGLNHPDLLHEEQYLSLLAEKAREQPHGGPRTPDV